MSGEVEVVRGGALALRGGQQWWDEQQLAALRAMGIEGAGAGDQALFLHVCQRTGLDPFARQIYMIGRRSKTDRGDWETRWTIQTGIEGYRLVAERTGRFAGRRGPWWCGEDGQWRDAWLQDTPPLAAKVEVLKSGLLEPVVGVAHWAEYRQTTKGGALTSMWSGMPAHMLGKCAEALALRSAFPQELSGTVTEEEEGRWTAQQVPGAAAAAPHPPESGSPAEAETIVLHSPSITDRPTRAHWDALEAAFTEWAAVTGRPVPDYPEQAQTISGIVGRTISTFKQLNRTDIGAVVQQLAVETAAAADAAYQASAEAAEEVGE